MKIYLIDKKRLIIPGLIIVAVLGITAAGIYEYRKSRWLAYRQAVEGQKAAEMTIRIVEGWSNQEIAEYLEKQGIVSAKDFLAATKNFDTSKYEKFLPEVAKSNLQGFLYPDTYRLFKSIDDRQVTPSDEAAKTVVAKLLDTFFKRLPTDAEASTKKQGLTLYEAVILASIVEKETGRNAVSAQEKAKLEEERKIVARIFYNRLRANLALQSDATINYITGKNDPTPALEDLTINSPYNTYKNRGLPPTPIGNPSLSAISAVLNPASTDYFYFLHIQPSGEPVYSKTFEEHVKNKQRYLK